MMSGMWFFVSLLVVGLALGVWVLVRMAGSGGRARDILAERLARGEVSQDEYRELLALMGGPPRAHRRTLPVAAVLVAVVVVGIVATAGFSMGRNGMDGMMGGMDGMSEMMRGTNGMMGGESGRDGEEAKTGAPERVVEGDEFSFAPETIRIPLGETVNVVFKNRGRMYHTLTVGQLNFELRAQGRETISGSVRASDAGTFRFFCAVPGHAESGMRGKIVVEDPTQ